MFSKDWEEEDLWGSGVVGLAIFIAFRDQCGTKMTATSPISFNLNTRWAEKLDIWVYPLLRYSLGLFSSPLENEMPPLAFNTSVMVPQDWEDETSRDSYEGRLFLFTPQFHRWNIMRVCLYVQRQNNQLQNQLSSSRLLWLLWPWGLQSWR